MSSLYRTASLNNAADIDYTNYVLWIGQFPGASGRNFQAISKHAAPRLNEGKLKIDILDPTLCTGLVTPAIKGITWSPIKPATNGAIYSAIAQHIINTKTHNEEFLKFTSQKAAWDGGYASYTNSSFLVITDENHPNYKKLMQAADAGFDVEEKKNATGAVIPNYVVIDAETGSPAVHNTCPRGEIYFEGEVNGIKVKTGFQLLDESVNEKTIEQYSEICGIPVSEIERMATELVSHGTNAAVQAGTAGTGASATTNGFDTATGREVLNALIGSNQMTGGRFVMGKGPVTGGKGPRYDLATVKGKPAVSAKNATHLSRNKPWKSTDEYKARVAAGESDPKPMLPWYDYALSSDNQVLMSAINKYPYQCKIMMSWMCNVLQGTSGAMRDSVIERLKDPTVVPLHIACDIVMGEMAQYSDYIVPDVTQYESFGFPSAEFPSATFGASMRWQASTPETLQLEDGRYASWETFLIDLAKVCELPGWGDASIPDKDGNMLDFNCSEDYYLKAAANLAYAETPIDDISEEEIQIQALDTLPESFKKAVNEEEYPKVLQIMSRGGRYWDPDHLRGEDGRCNIAKEYQTFIYNEKRAIMKNPYSGKSYSGSLTQNEEVLSDMSLVSDTYSREEYPFMITEHKPRFRSLTMLSNSPIMRDLCAHNYIEINIEDAKEYSVKDGDIIKLVTPQGDITQGHAMVRAGQIKGSASLSFGYGHIGYGAADTIIDGVETKGNPDISAGARAHIMLDPLLSKDGVICFWGEPYTSSCARNGGMFKLEKA